jgi:hypothetical protein
MPDIITTYAQVKAINAGEITCYPSWYWKGGTIRGAGNPSRCLPDSDYNRRKFDVCHPHGIDAAVNDVLIIEYDPNPAGAWKPVRRVHVVKGLTYRLPMAFGATTSSTPA